MAPGWSSVGLPVENRYAVRSAPVRRGDFARPGPDEHHRVGRPSVPRPRPRAGRTEGRQDEAPTGAP